MLIGSCHSSSKGSSQILVEQVLLKNFWGPYIDSSDYRDPNTNQIPIYIFRKEIVLIPWEDYFVTRESLQARLSKLFLYFQFLIYLQYFCTKSTGGMLAYLILLDILAAFDRVDLNWFYLLHFLYLFSYLTYDSSQFLCWFLLSTHHPLSPPLPFHVSWSSLSTLTPTVI